MLLFRLLLEVLVLVLVDVIVLSHPDSGVIAARHRVSQMKKTTLRIVSQVVPSDSTRRCPPKMGEE